MEELLSPLPISTIFSLLLLYYGFRVFYSIWWKPKSLEKQLRQQGIRGNPYRLLYGDMKEEMETIKATWSKPINLTHQILPRAMPFAHRTVQKYGRRSSLQWVGTSPRVMLSDPELVREVFMNKFGQFQKPSVNPLIKLLAMGVSSLEGDEWAKRRRVITPAFHLEKLKGMVPAFLTSCTDMIKRWQDFTKPDGSCEIDVWPELQTLTGDVISRTAFGSNYEEGKKIFELQKEQVVLVLEAARAPYIPGFRYVPTAKNKRRMYIDTEIKRMLREMIARKLSSMRSRDDVGDDLLGLLLQLSNARDKQYSITTEDVIEECKLFYFAGQETTSVWLTWTLILLAQHPIWQQRAREEVLSVCGKSTPNFESISHLKIVTMILNEVLRLYPPVVSLFRQTIEKTKLGELTLPAGVDILLPIIFIHHDRELWGEDSEEFNPERFSEGISKASKVPNAFFPFGWGPRICLGQSFAIIEAKMALASILQNFSFELSSSYAHAPYTVITLQPQYGAHIILHQLEDNC